MSGNEECRVVRAFDVTVPEIGEDPWLIKSLWSRQAVGIIGGAPKCCKSWLALEMAVAVASGRPCLGRYLVPSPGPALLFSAEDPPFQVRERLKGLSRARGVGFPELEVGLIIEPSLRIDRAEDLARLRTTIERRRPKLLLLDPYVRLQRVDENNSTEVSRVLGALRDLSREFELSIALVHHARKGTAEQTGQALRGRNRRSPLRVQRHSSSASWKPSPWKHLIARRISARSCGCATSASPRFSISLNETAGSAAPRKGGAGFQTCRRPVVPEFRSPRGYRGERERATPPWRRPFSKCTH